MCKLIKCELLKLKSMLGAILAFFFPLLLVSIGLLNIYTGSVKISGTSEMWNAIYVQSSSLYGGILFPVFLSALVSLQWRVEFKNNNINNILITDKSHKDIYLSKIFSTFVIAFINIILYIIIIFISVKVLLPKETVKAFIFYGPIIGLLFSLPLICIQHFLSMNFKNFALPLVIGIVLSLPNFVASCYSFSTFIPYSYICKGMFFNVKNSLNVECPIYIFILTALIFVASVSLGTKVFKNKEFR
ncbi:ABC-2 type transport system permease protein [Clostridium acetobutylicum]|uniref:Uncharacterized membrane protein n=1 Tax=Clostridium acetobutylicum (strain ATCC 824 / DSM 792 / JCM 1419 / IAM 19013 / LMG 5710 / NBRC 13948 / NRRL B-527 / VKM B-1787 / 2291 / W) TaxID=272562 RepID=Q97MB2_CLOAB|nr:MULTISPECIES: ABC transporter permease [Clostridium]AAK78267.1 Uncharacterized membrane protein [Clostridium acetobutylicum ATCC 824]ADZ19334.1 Conserved hypothetical protein [Clostridium acetobutylicum EA 2018]AEI31148.1 hypothetical protein SMB_G0292 [Clostridium acetobutylicum DSM 1731]AWV82117.1 hypothetical protein DK921_18980 [Clostridium acetobutylicum]AWV82166.1 hypothetical protein DK921_19290 [Clostridium acetobutylicum]